VTVLGLKRHFRRGADGWGSSEESRSVTLRVCRGHIRAIFYAMRRLNGQLARRELKVMHLGWVAELAITTVEQ
jgi:hypothetical protein